MSTNVFSLWRKESRGLKISIVLMILCLLLFSALPAAAEQTYQTLWTKLIGTPYEDNVSDLAIDSYGYVYAVGKTAGSLDGNANMGGEDIVLLKFDQNGNKLWARQIGTPMNDAATGITLDKNGYLYVTGRTYGSLYGYPNAGGADIFLMKADLNGVPIWIQQFGSPGDDFAARITADENGDVYLTGYTNGGLDGNTSSGGYDLFLIKYDQYGTRQWTRQLATAAALNSQIPPTFDYAAGVSVDGAGSVYIAGYSGTGLHGNEYYGGQDAVLVKFDQSGNWLWTRQSGTPTNDGATGVVASNGYIYVTGHTDGGLDGNLYLGSTDIFLMKYDQSGNKLWTKQIGTPIPDFVFNMVTDLPGNIYLIGMLHQALDGNYGYENGCDIGLFKFDPNGNLLAGQKMGQTLMDHSFAIAVDNSGHIHIGGQTENPLGGNPIVGGMDIFLMKLDNSGTGSALVSAWGWNYLGQLGDGTTANRGIPGPVPIDGVTALAAAMDNSLALKADGTVWQWGSNNDGVPGISPDTYSVVPFQVPGLHGVTKVTGGWFHALALTSDGTVWTWGNNTYGQLGDGTYTYRAIPAQVNGLFGITAVAGGNGHSLALRSDGTVWAWGDNYYGQLGNGTYDGSLVPVQVMLPNTVIAIAAGFDHSLALTLDGKVWTWGYHGETPTFNNRVPGWGRSIPIQVPGLDSMQAIAGGGWHSVALRMDGTVWGWGMNGDGQLGDGTTAFRDIPVQATGLMNVKTIAAKCVRSVALKQDGTVWTWGTSFPGSSSVMPVQVTGLGGVSSLAAGMFHTLVLTPANALIIVTPSLPSGTLNIPYHGLQLQGVGGMPPYTWSVVSGSMPPGLGLDSSSGIITGTPISAGTYNVTIQLMDAELKNASRSFSIRVYEAFSITTSSLSAGVTGNYYNQTLSAEGGTLPYTWSVILGSLPAGLSLESSTGSISGYPATSGAYNFTVQAVDADGLTATKPLTISVSDPLVISTNSLPPGTVAKAYSQTLSAAGGQPPYTWSVTYGNLPPGLSLDSSTGLISGIPSSTGSSFFGIQVTDANSTTYTKYFWMSVYDPLIITTPRTLPPGILNNAYSVTLTATGGVPYYGYGWSIVSGTMPWGLSLDPYTGEISGHAYESGTFDFYVQVYDSNSTTTAHFSLSIYEHPTIITPPSIIHDTFVVTLQPGLMNTPYSQALSVSGGREPYTWSVITGSLPAGVTLDASTGSIAGYPSESGKFDYTVQVVDSLGQSAKQMLTTTTYSEMPPVEVWSSSFDSGLVLPDRPYGIAADGNGNVYVTGEAEQADNGRHWMTVKYDASGNLIWSKPAVILSFPPYSGYQSGARAITTDGNGNVYVTGFTWNWISDFDFHTIKYDSSGNEIWAKTYVGSAGGGEDFANSVAVDGGGGVYVSGSAGADTPLLKYDAAGNLAWAKTYHEEEKYNHGAGIALDGGGNINQAIYAFSGWSNTTGWADQHILIVRYDPDGNVLWTMTDDNDGKRNIIPNGIAVDTSGNILLSATIDQRYGNKDFILIKYDQSGNRLWSRAYEWGSYISSSASSVFVDNSGNSYVTGRRGEIGGQLQESLFTIKYDPNGALVWIKTYGPGDYSFAAAFDNGGNLYAARDITGASVDFLTTKYRQISKLGITTSSLPSGIKGAVYTQTVTAAGGVLPYSWSITSGTLPPGLTLNNSTGEISGTPTEGGTFTFSVKVVDANSSIASKDFSITVQVISPIITATAGVNGSIAPSGTLNVDYGSIKTFLITPDVGYHIAYVTGCNGTLIGNLYTTEPVTANCAVEACFAINTYTVTPTAGVNGSVTPSTPQSVDYKKTASFTITPEVGYHIVSVTGCGGTLAGNIYTTGLITADCVINASFAINRYSLTVSNTGSGTGTVTSSPTGITCGADCSEVYDHGTPVTLTATPSADSVFAGWNGGGCAGTGPCTVSMADHESVTATFTKAIAVSSPNGGEIWNRGSSYKITWAYAGGGASVKIELLRNGAVDRVISSSTSIGSNGTGSYSWRTNGVTPGTNYQIRITNLTNSAFTDTSDGNFTISK